MEQQIPLAAKPMVDAHRPFVWAKKAAIGCRNWPCWRVRSRTAWPPHYRCAPPAFGTGTPNAPLDSYGGRSWGRFFQVRRPLYRSEYGKRPRPPPICPRGRRPVGVKRLSKLPDYASGPPQSSCQSAPAVRLAMWLCPSATHLAETKVNDSVKGREGKRDVLGEITAEERRLPRRSRSVSVDKCPFEG